MNYVIFYIILAALIPLSLKSRLPRNISFLGYKWNLLILLAFVIVVVVRAFAYDTGADYMVYYDNFRYNGNTAWGENREIGYKILNHFLYNVSSSPHLFFGFAAFIYMYAVLKVSQLFGKADKWIVFFWFVILFVLSYNLYRQYFSLSFILLGYYWFVKGKCARVFFYGILAFLFHTSAIIGLVMIAGIYLLRKKVVNRTYLIVAILLTTILSDTILMSYLESFNFISEFYLRNTEKAYTTQGMLDSMYERSVLTYPSMIAYLIFIWYGDKMVKEKPDYRYLFYLFSFAVIINPLTNQEILMRIRLYVDVFIPLFLGLLAYRYNKMYRYPIVWCALIFLIAKFVYGLYNLGMVYPLQFKC